MKAFRPKIRLWPLPALLCWICGCQIESRQGITVGRTSTPNAPSYYVTDFFDGNRPKEGSPVCVIGVVDSFEDINTFWLRPDPISIASPCLQVQYWGRNSKDGDYWNPIGQHCVVYGTVAYEEVKDPHYFSRRREDYRQGVSTNADTSSATRLLFIKADQIRARDRLPAPTGEFERR